MGKQEKLKFQKELYNYRFRIVRIRWWCEMDRFAW